MLRTTKELETRGAAMVSPAEGPAYVRFTEAHIKGAHALSKEEKWPHRGEDWEQVLKVSLGMVAIGSEGEVVGTAMATPFGNDVATVSMIIVHKDWQGRSVGRTLTEKVMALVPNRVLHLISSEAGRRLYSKLGFKETHQTFQARGMVAKDVAAEHAEGVQESPMDLARMIEQDSLATGMQRAMLLTLVAQSPGAVVLSSHDQGHDAFALIRDFGDWGPHGTGKVVGPIVAPNLPMAQKLLAAAAARCEGKILRVDTSDEDLVQFAVETLQLEKQPGGTAMIRGPTSYALFSRGCL